MIASALPTAIALALAIPSIAWGAWWTFECSVALLPLRQTHTRKHHRHLSFTVVIPAHNEEDLVGRTVASLLAAEHEPRPELLVVADNCNDRTADVARAAGASVLERVNPGARGKSNALNYALAELRARDTAPDVVIIVDADSRVSAGFFTAIAAAIQGGAAIVQAHYAAEFATSDIGRLRRLAFALVHWSRPLGAKRLALPTTLKGNGMAFRWPLLAGGFPGEGITEDADATLRLLQRGQVITFEPRATVFGLMTTTYSQAATQELRWEGGRLALFPRSIAAAFQALARGRLRCAAAALELASPPLTMVGIASTASLLVGLTPLAPLWPGMAASAILGLYVAMGLAAARPDPRDLAALLHAPRFVAHKLAAYRRLLRGAPQAWERTSRGDGG